MNRKHTPEVIDQGAVEVPVLETIFRQQVLEALRNGVANVAGIAAEVQTKWYEAEGLQTAGEHALDDILGE